MNEKKVKVFFIIGIIATIAYRIIIFTDEALTQILWYIGTVGFILYFWHRAEVQKKRSDMVRDNSLITVVDNIKRIDVKKKQALMYLVRTARTSKARWNSLVIFWLSVLALVAGLIYDFVL